MSRMTASAWQTVTSGREKRRQDLLSAKLRASWAPPMSVNPHWDRPRLVNVLLPFKAWAMACAPAPNALSAQMISILHMQTDRQDGQA